MRVEATRLRRAIERYYSGPGADDPVHIRLVRGNYVPVFYYRDEQREPALNVSPAVDNLQSGNGMPTLFIQPFDVLTSNGRQTVSGTTLHEKLCDAFARFDTINIISGADQSAEAGASYNYRLKGSVEYRDDETTNVNFRLLDSSDGTVVWSRVFERLTTAGGRAAARMRSSPSSLPYCCSRMA